MLIRIGTPQGEHRGDSVIRYTQSIQILISGTQKQLVSPDSAVCSSAQKTVNKQLQTKINATKNNRNDNDSNKSCVRCLSSGPGCTIVTLASHIIVETDSL